MGEKLSCEDYVKLARKGLLTKNLCNDARRACHYDKIKNYKVDDWNVIQKICDKDKRKRDESEPEPEPEPSRPYKRGRGREDDAAKYWLSDNPITINYSSKDDDDVIQFTSGEGKLSDRRLQYLNNGSLKRLISEMKDGVDDSKVLLPFKPRHIMPQHLVLECRKITDNEWEVKALNDKEMWNEAKITNSGKCKSPGTCGNLQGFLQGFFHDQYVFDSDGTIYYTGFSYGGGGQERNNRGIYRRNKKKKTSKRKRKITKRKITKRKKKSLKKTKRR